MSFTVLGSTKNSGAGSATSKGHMNHSDLPIRFLRCVISSNLSNNE